MKDRIKELVEIGESALDDATSMTLRWCPLCDICDWIIWKMKPEEGEEELEIDENIDCYQKHSDYIFYQDFNKYHIEANDLKVLLKFFKLREESK